MCMVFKSTDHIHKTIGQGWPRIAPLGYEFKSLHAKHYNTWAIGFEHYTPDTGLKLVALLHMFSLQKISEDSTK